MMAMAIKKRSSAVLVASEQDSCPFDDQIGDVCIASLSGFIIAPERKTLFCSTENYDACPFFLSRIIRRA
jgi:hypothetical protein